METRKLASVIVSGLNDLAEKIEEALAEDGGDEGGKGKGKDRASSSTSSRSSRSSARGKDADESDDDDDDKDDDDGDGDEPSSDDCVKAARAALKVLEKDEVTKIVKKYGKVEKSADVPADKRQAVIDALEKAVEEAE